MIISIVADAALGGKAFVLTREKSDQYRAPKPGASRVAPRVNDSGAAKAVYISRDRLGSYRRVGGMWVAIDRLGRPLGQFDSEFEAEAAISSSVGRP